MRKKTGKSNPRQPLKGRTILVTQAADQAKRFSRLLKAKGATILECPTILIESYETDKIREILKHIENYHWLIFMSQNAVSHFFSLLKKYKISKTKLKGIRIAAIGKTTRGALKQSKLRVHLVPSVHQSEYLAASFKRKIEGKNFLILSACEGRTVVSDVLKDRGANVDTLPLYKTVLPKENARLLSTYLHHERIDAITFTSPSTFSNFMALLKPDRHMRTYLETVTIATLGDVTAEAVERQGLRVRVKPSDFTIPAFVNTLSREL